MKGSKSIMQIVLPLVLAGGILWWMYRGMDWAALSTALHHDMRWGWMLASMPFGVLPQVLRALRWRQLLHPLGQQPRVSTAINAVFLSYASSLVIPRVGEVLRCGVLRRYDGCSFSHGVGTVVTERVVDMMMIGVIAVITFVAQIPVFMDFMSRTGVSISGFLSQFTSTGYVVTAICGIGIIVAACVLLRRFRFLARTRAAATEMWQGMLSLRQVEGRGLFIAYSLGIWVSYYLHFYLTFFCFDATSGVGPMAALVAFVVGTFAVLVPTPNGAGPWHFAVKTVLMLYGVAAADGAMFVLIVHTLQTALLALLGLWAALMLARTDKIQTTKL